MKYDYLDACCRQQKWRTWAEVSAVARTEGMQLRRYKSELPVTQQVCYRIGVEGLQKLVMAVSKELGVPLTPEALQFAGSLDFQKLVREVMLENVNYEA